MNPEKPPEPIKDLLPSPTEIEKKDIDPNTCPQCLVGTLNHHGACVRCPNCGYYSCSLD